MCHWLDMQWQAIQERDTMAAVVSWLNKLRISVYTSDCDKRIWQLHKCPVEC